MIGSPLGRSRSRAGPRHPAAARTTLLLMLAASAAAPVGCEMFAPDFGEVAAARIRSERERADQRDAIVDLRLDSVVAPVLERHDVDCWLIVTSGARPDPLARLVAPSAIRDAARAILLSCPDPPGGPIRTALVHGLEPGDEPGGTYVDVHRVEDASAAGTVLRRELRRAEPERVAWNRSPSFPLADGLSDSDRAWIEEAVGSRPGWEWASSAPLVPDLLTHHLDVEVPLFAEAAARTADVLELVLRSEVVRPGKSSLRDMRWAFRQHAADLGLEPAGSIRIRLHRPDGGAGPGDPRYLESWPLPGDLIFVTAGIDYLGYAPRLGRWAYVSREGELAPPAEVVAGLEGLVRVLEEVGPRIRPGISRAAAEAMLTEALGGDAGVEARLTPLGTFPAEWWAGADPGRDDAAPAPGSSSADRGMRRNAFYAVELSWLLELPGWSVPAPLRIVEPAVVTEEGLRAVVEPEVEPAFIE